uniref:Uncharacterized protein n=1 Tax=Picea sitchensis TaxID=3332 RepID=A0A6B9XQA3_PICSI|nr:hypothetical protein Q903MT_gene4273 [Picea sitchensis]
MILFIPTAAICTYMKQDFKPPNPDRRWKEGEAVPPFREDSRDLRGSPETRFGYLIFISILTTVMEGRRSRTSILLFTRKRKESN